MKKMLVVDDDIRVRALIRRVFQQAGFEVLECADGQGVSRLVQRERPAIVVMDMHMPKVDGISALGAILDEDPGVAVIMVSGDDDLELAKRAMARGACDYVTKPFDLRSLQMSVRAYAQLAG